MRPIISSVVAALRLLGFWKAGTPLEIASTPVSAAQPDENARSSRNDHRDAAEVLVAVLRNQLQRRRSRPAGRVAEEVPDRPRRAPMPDDAGHEEVDRQRERRAGLAHPAQVHGREQRDQPDRDDTSCPRTNGQRRRGVLHAGGDRHRDGEDVVDEQRAGHGEAGLGSEVGAGHLVVATARRGRRGRSAGRTRRPRASRTTTQSAIFHELRQGEGPPARPSVRKISSGA